MTRPDRPVAVLFVVVVPLQAAFVLLLPYFVTVDGATQPFVQLVVLCGLVGLYSLWPKAGEGWRIGLRQAILLAIAVAPVLILATMLVAERPPAVGPSTCSPLVSLAATLALAWGMVTLHAGELVFTTLVALILAALLLFGLRDRLRLRRRDPGDVYLVFGIVAIVEVALVPSGITLGSGGSYVAQRLAFVPVLAALLWLAGRELPRRAPRLVAIGCTVAAIGRAAPAGSHHIERRCRGVRLRGTLRRDRIDDAAGQSRSGSSR